MKKAIPILLFLSVVSGIYVFPQNLTITKVGEWGGKEGGPYREVFIKGDYAYCTAGEGGLDIINVSNPSNPIKVADYYTLSSTLDVHVVGNYAYVTELAGRLLILDVTNPTSPTLADSCDFFYDPEFSNAIVEDMHVVGNSAWVTASKWLGDPNIPNPFKGWLIRFDISNPASIGLDSWRTWRSQGPLGLKLHAVGNYLYVNGVGSGLEIINITNPTSPTLAGSYVTYGYGYDVCVVGNYAYLVGKGLQIIDVTNPASPILVSSYGYRINYECDMHVVGNYAYLVGTLVATHKDLQIIDVTDPASPKLVGSYDLPPNLISGDAEGVYVDGRFAFVIFGGCSWLSNNCSGCGLRIIDIKYPASPTLTGSYSTCGRGLRVHVVGNYAYLAEPLQNPPRLAARDECMPLRGG